MEFQPILSWASRGHCIGVDPYYLTYQSQRLGYEPAGYFVWESCQ